MQEAQHATRPPAAAPELGSGPETRRTGAGDQTAVNTVRARQGVTGHNVRFVLGVGLVAVVAGFLVVAYLTGAFG
jgi:hypothetical protein